MATSIAQCLVGEFGPKRTLVVAAHPDDEIVGLGGQLAYLASNVRIVHVTNGVPPWGDASLAEVRHVEARAALTIAGVPSEALVRLGFADQRLVDSACSAALRLQELVASFQPELVMSAPYEGGHPDHDACAWAVASAIAGMDIEHWEWASYHAAPDGRLVSGAFVDSAPEQHVVLSTKAALAKQRMFECHASQRETLALFPVGSESFRRAPRYDFTKRPAPCLFYETRPWDITFESFAERLRAAK